MTIEGKKQVVELTDKNLVDRSRVDVLGSGKVKPLFPDLYAEGRRFFDKTGLYPINHGVVVRRSILEQHPWVALNLYKAFVRANDVANEQRLEHAEYYRDAGLITRAAYEAMTTGLVQHGVKANRAVLETAARYSYEQGLTPRVIPLDDVFARSTMDV